MMLFSYIFIGLLSCNSLQSVLSAPLPVNPGDVVSYRQPKAVGQKKANRRHPAIVVSGPIVGANGIEHDIVEASHNLPVGEHLHQNPVGHYTAGLAITLNQHPAPSLSMTPTRVLAKLLKPGEDGNIGQDNLARLEGDINECKGGHCNHVTAPAQGPGQLVAPPAQGPSQSVVPPAQGPSHPAVPPAQAPNQPAKPPAQGPSQPAALPVQAKVWGGQKGPAHQAGPAKKQEGKGQ